MRKYFLIFFLFASFNHSHGMNFIDSSVAKISSWFNSTNTKQELLIKTTDNKIINCKQPTIQLSALLTRAHEIGLFTSENKALHIGLSTADFAFFIAASNKQTNKFFDSLTLEQLLVLADIAYALKSPKLYAQLIKIIMPSDIDHQIAHAIFSIKKIKNLIIKKMQPKTVLHRIEIPLIEKPIMKTQCTHDEQFYITTIQGTLFNDAPFNQCIIKNMHTHAIIKELSDYDIIQCHPTKNIIALGSTQKKSDTPTLILYTIDTDTTATLVHDENIKFLTFSPNGKYLAATYNTTDNTSISLWETTNTSEKLSLTGHTEIIDALAFNPQSTCIISGSPEIENCVILWNIENSHSIKHTLLLTQKHNHFKGFIFGKNGQTILAITKKGISFLFAENKQTSLPTPVYAIFNAPTIPQITASFNERNNLVEDWNPYTILMAHGESTDYSMVRVNQNETRSAAYKTNQKLNLYILSFKDKTIPRKELTGHHTQVHSLEFSEDDLLVSACQNKAVIWDHKGNLLQTIRSQRPTSNTYLNKSGQCLFALALSKHGGYPCACTEVIQLYTTATAQTYKNINKNLSTSQAILLNAIYKQNKHDLHYVITSQSLEELAINSFSNADECKLIHQIFMITYSDNTA